MTCKGRVLYHSPRGETWPKTEQKTAAVQVWVWCCYWDVESNLEAEPPMSQHQGFCSPVVSDGGCTCAEKHCSDVDDIFWCEGSNVLKRSHHQGTGRSYNFLLQTKLLIQCGQGEFLFEAVPVLVHWLFGDDKCHLFLVAVRCVAPSPTVRLQCSSSERTLESLIPHPSLLAGLCWYWAASLWGKCEPEQFAVLRQRSCWLCNQLPAAFLGFCN